MRSVYKDIAVVIPARLASVRLPRKVLADIGGIPMVIRVANAAAAANVGDVYIACDDDDVLDIVSRYTHRVIMTDRYIESGTDRVHSVAHRLHHENVYRNIINLQADLPTIDPTIIQEVAERLLEGDADIVTAVAQTTIAEAQNSNAVKAVLSDADRVVYFSRALCPWGEGELFHHIGIYGYTEDALRTFAKAPRTLLEKRESLEQLRALENGLKMFAVVVDSFPTSVDTQEDLDKVRAELSSSNSYSSSDSDGD
ncbi:3-deoxy-manno-octulosonate cytidylyltransferase [Rickettsiales endosymbiont of Peranema trichophorum]|uniref:3-deoxy-manno-octulosonate cytidylyltransferase n=1 Tax=Rickettsiales endosymbiont of Peranema trichophorum TaxID=2486577 RepID=UPI0010230A25|nr:3-deoxy-manno-octulosonate cytidylyltransferase [Rickettsiales endosymbiont of Peranema trichophorum]RZI45152.1 3-deoxy-manno-octulosonate cytidylyltransferase [Rickettsiales endosymbiont of Peranema trichophorum]